MRQIEIDSETNLRSLPQAFNCIYLNLIVYIIKIFDTQYVNDSGAWFNCEVLTFIVVHKRSQSLLTAVFVHIHLDRDVGSV